MILVFECHVGHCIGIGLGGVWGLDVLTKMTPMGKLDRDTSSLLPLIIKCRNNGYAFGVIWIPIHVGKGFIAAAAFIKNFGRETREHEQNYVINKSSLFL